MRIGRLFLVACGSTVALGSIGCAAAPRSAARALPDETAWAGVYAATDPRDGSASLLSIRWVTLPDEATARPIYHLYARLGDAGRLDVVGAARIDGDRLTFAIATARLDEEGDSHAIATVERYVYRRAGGRVALIREESLEGNGGSLEGVLIKVADDAAELEDEPSDAERRSSAERRSRHRVDLSVRPTRRRRSVSDRHPEGASATEGSGGVPGRATFDGRQILRRRASSE